VNRYQKKHSPTHHPDHHPIFISFFHLLQSIACCLFKLRAWQHFVQPLSTSCWSGASYSTHFFTQSVSSFRNICPWHRSLFCCLFRSTPYLELNISLRQQNLSTNSRFALAPIRPVLVTVFEHPLQINHFITLYCIELLLTPLPHTPQLSSHSLILLIRSSSFSAIATKSSA